MKRADAMKLVDEIRHAKVAAFCIAERVGHPGLNEAAFLGGLESVLCHFLLMQGCRDASAALPAAMNDVPSAGQIAARSAEIAQLGKPQPAKT